jgi:hypothetical protein
MIKSARITAPASRTHPSMVQPHTRAARHKLPSTQEHFPKTQDHCGTGKASIASNWEKSAKQTRTEEIKEDLEKLKEPEVDGDRVLLLAQEVTAVTGQNREQHKSSIFFDKGNTCSMITKNIVRRLGLESLKRTIVVKSFMHTEAIYTEFVVVELLKEDGTVALVRAYVVDSITEMTKVTVPEEIR